MKRRILISAPYFLPVIERFRPRLEAHGLELVTAQVKERLEETELLEMIEDIDGVICGDDRLTKKVLRRANRLKVISKWGTGIDSIDIAAAANLGIRVCRTPNAFTDPVADTTLGYILSFARQLPQMDQNIRAGRWTKSPSVSLRECTLGIIGLGQIGQAVAFRAHAFGMKLLGTDPAPVPESFVSAAGIDIVPFNALLAGSDFITLHCDLNPTSFHLIDRAALEIIRTSAYLINTSRGGVIDEKALVEALSENRLAGAALDVFEIEPLPLESPLRKLDNCLLAPHNSNGSPLAWERVHQSTIENLLRGLNEVDDRPAEFGAEFIISSEMKETGK